MVEMAADPRRGARRSDRDRQASGQTPHECDRAGHRIDSRRHHARVLGLARGVEIVRQRATDPCLDRADKVRPRQTHELCHRLLCRRWMADAGEIGGDLAIADQFALDQHTVEIEDDRGKLHARVPNKAVPTRTCVAPIITAVSKSPDMPILNPASPDSPASLASKAK